MRAVSVAEERRREDELVTLASCGISHVWRPGSEASVRCNQVALQCLEDTHSTASGDAAAVNSDHDPPTHNKVKKRILL